MARPYHIASFLREIIDEHRFVIEDLDELEEFASKKLDDQEKEELKQKLAVFRGAIPGFQRMPGSVKSYSDARQLCDDMLKSYFKFQNRFRADSRMLSIEEIGQYRREWERLLERAEFLFQQAQDRERRDFHEHGGI